MKPHEVVLCSDLIKELSHLNGKINRLREVRNVRITDTTSYVAPSGFDDKPVDLEDKEAQEVLELLRHKYAKRVDEITKQLREMGIEL